MRYPKLLVLMPILGMVLIAAVALHPVKALCADQSGITLAGLAGGWAESDSGFITQCVGGCAAPTQLVPFNVMLVGQVTFDDLGNFCAARTSLSAPVAGTSKVVSPVALTIVGTITAFDPITESGDGTFKFYGGGSCTGAVFNSAGSTFRGTSSIKLVVSANGNHIAMAIGNQKFAATLPINGAILFGALDRQQFEH
jgi:hypothetical protein